MAAIPLLEYGVALCGARPRLVLLLARGVLRRLLLPPVTDGRDVDGREMLRRLLPSLPCGEEARDGVGVLTCESEPRFSKYFGFFSK